MPNNRRQKSKISPSYKEQRRPSTLLEVKPVPTTSAGTLLSSRPSNLVFNNDFSSLDEPNKDPAEDFEQGANTLTNYKNFEEFL